MWNVCDLIILFSYLFQYSYLHVWQAISCGLEMGSGGSVKAIPDIARMISQAFSEPSFGFPNIAFFYNFLSGIQKDKLGWSSNSSLSFLIFRIWFLLIFMFLPSIMYGQAAHPFPHIVNCLIGLWLAGGTVALIRYCFKFACFLKAENGGSGNISVRYWLLLVIDLQCLALIVWKNYWWQPLISHRLLCLLLLLWKEERRPSSAFVMVIIA